MKISELLNLKNRKAIISICGGGGKTSTLFRLASELKGKRVLITTTTKISKPEKSDNYELIIGENSANFINSIKSKRLKNSILCASSLEKSKNKLYGCTEEFIDNIKDYFDIVIVEADGSAGKPLKAPAAHEPVVHHLTSIYIGVIGLDCLNRPATAENVHRPEYFSQIRNKKDTYPVSIDDLVKLIDSESGLFKKAPKNCTKVVFLNKADILTTEEYQNILEYISLNAKNYDMVLINSFKEENSVLAYNRN